VRPDDPADRVAGGRQRVPVERPFGVAGGEAGGEQQPVALAQRHVELFGEPKDHAGARWSIVRQTLAALIAAGDVDALASSLSDDFVHHRPDGTRTKADWLADVRSVSQGRRGSESPASAAGTGSRRRASRRRM